MKGGLRLRLAAACFTVGPAIVHFAVAPAHLVIYWPYGVFFLFVGLGQLGLAAALVASPSSKVLLGGSVGTLAVIGIWLASRTLGLPISPGARLPEPIGLPDLATSFMEFIAVVLMLLADSRLDMHGTRTLPGASPGLITAAAATLVLTTVALAGAGSVGH